MPGRCAVCFCPEDFHKHFTHSRDLRCGTCGPAACPAYVDPAQKLSRLSPDQRRTRQIAEERARFNALCLMPFAQSSQQVAAMRIPQQRPPEPVTTYLDRKRAEHRERYRRG